MKIKKIFKKLILNKWVKVDLNKCKDFYLIGIKNKSSKKDAVAVEKVKRIKFEIAIETGVKNKYITLSYPIINFDELSSSDINLNKITGYTRCSDGPSKFFIRAIEVADGFNAFYKDGKVAISVKINPQKSN